MKNFLAAIPPEHPLLPYLRDVRRTLEAHAESVRRLKSTIVDRLVTWSEDLQGMDWDGVGTFVYDGIRERLQKLLPEELSDAIQIEMTGIVNLSDDDGKTMIGQLHLPSRESWTQLVQSHEHEQRTVQPAFVPYGCNRYIDPNSATPDGPGPFTLSPTETIAAIAAMAAGRIEGFITMASNIHAHEEHDEYGILRIRLNIEDALHVCGWVQMNLAKQTEALPFADLQQILRLDDEVGSSGT